MKQKFTSKKTRELELKKSMLNFKMFSLMKKQLFSLVMMLALIVMAGTSAFAQDGLTVATAYWHMPGSTHHVSVTNHAGFTYAWGITMANCDGSAGAAVADGTGIAGAGNTATITYSDDAAGVYRITVTETDGDGGCNTIRQFYTAVMNVNVVVTSTLADGTTAAPAADCNDYDLVGPTLSYLVPNTNADDGGGSSANLAALTSASLYNERWVHLVLSVSDASGCPGIGNAPTAADLAWRFDYTIADGGATGTNYVDNFVAMQATANVTFTDATDETSTITVAEGTTAITIPLRSNIRWATTNTDADQSFTFNVANLVVDDDGDATFQDGGESTANEAIGNTSALQYINASPATQRIQIVD